MAIALPLDPIYVLRMSDDRQTLPPAEPDTQAADFEQQIQEQGESSARWQQLMALLESSAESAA